METKEELTKQVEVLESELQKLKSQINEINSNQEFKEYFLSLISGYKIKFSDNIILFFNKEGKRLMDYDQKNNCFYLSYTLVWSKLETKFAYNNQNIRELIKDILEEHLKLKDITTYRACHFLDV